MIIQANRARHKLNYAVGSQHDRLYLIDSKIASEYWQVGEKIVYLRETSVELLFSMKVREI